MNRKFLKEIKQFEKNSSEHTTAKDKWVILNNDVVAALDVPDEPIISDIGGTGRSAQIIKSWWSKSYLSTLNLSHSDDMESLNLSELITANLDDKNFDAVDNDSLDIVFFMDIIEHLIDPDNALINLRNIIKDKGYLIISTPNFADIFNRIFMLFGWSTHNYNVSQYYKTGNPFIKDISGKRHGNHKSMFMVNQLKELLSEVYGMEIVFSKGYSYYEQDWLSYYSDKDSAEFLKDRLSRIEVLRKWISPILPLSMSEGMLLVCKVYK